MRITKKLIFQWMYCLNHSPYRDYCQLREVDDLSCAIFESKFPRFKQFYQELGIPKLKDDSWYDKHWTQFVVMHATRVVSDAKKYVYKPGYLLLSVPIHEIKLDTLNSLRSLIDFHYEVIIKYDSAESTFDSAKVMLKPLENARPKYELHGEVNAATESRISRAIYAHRLRGSGPQYKLSQTDAVIAIMEAEKNPFDWVMTAQDKKDHERGTFKKSLFNGAKVKMLKKAEEDFAALAKNVIQGRFPDFS